MVRHTALRQQAWQQSTCGQKTKETAVDQLRGTSRCIAPLGAMLAAVSSYTLRLLLRKLIVLQFHSINTTEPPAVPLTCHLHNLPYQAQSPPHLQDLPLLLLALQLPLLPSSYGHCCHH
jgi:hypothetical protein